MKSLHKLVLFALILGYSFTSISWIGPLANYCFNSKYIADVFCEKKAVEDNVCKGKCYLNKKIAQQVDSGEENSNTQVLLTPQFEFPAHSHSEIETITFFSSSLKGFFKEAIAVSQWTDLPITPPPEVA